MTNLIIALVSQISDPNVSGAQWTIDGVTDHGTFDHGGLWIVVPSGSVTVSRSNITPAAGADGETHGLMKNPLFSNWAFGSHISNYTAASNITTSTTVSANDCLVLGVGRDGNAFEGFSVLHVLAEAPPTNAICPPPFGYDGSTARPMHTIDIAAATAAISTFDYTGLYQLYSVADNMGLRRSHEPYAVAAGPLETHRRYHGAVTGGYGTDQAKIWSRALHTFLNDASTTEQRETLLGWMMTNACMWDYGLSLGAPFQADGGWGQGCIALIKLFRKLTNRSLSTGYDTNETTQPMIIDQSFLDALGPHDGTSGYPAISRRQTVTAVSGLTVTFTGTGILGNDTRLVGTRLVRNDGGVEANILSVTQSSDGQPVTATLETSNPFSVDDVVYATDRQGFVIGDITWGIRGRTQSEGLQRYSPSPYPRYSQLQIWDTVMFIAAMGTDYVDAEILPALKWIKESMADNIPATGDHLTTPYGDYPEVIGHGGSGSGNTGREFWTTYGATAVDAAITALEA